MNYETFKATMSDLKAAVGVRDPMYIATRVSDAVRATTPAEFSKEYEPMCTSGALVDTRLALAWEVAETFQSRPMGLSEQTAVATIGLALIEFPVPYSASSAYTLDCSRQSAIDDLVRLDLAQDFIATRLPDLVLASSKWLDDGGFEEANQSVFPGFIVEVTKKLKWDNRVACIIDVMRCILMVMYEHPPFSKKPRMLRSMIASLRKFACDLTSVSVVHGSLKRDGKPYQVPPCRASKKVPALTSDQTTKVHAVGRQFLEVLQKKMTCEVAGSDKLHGLFEDTLDMFRQCDVISLEDLVDFMPVLVQVLNAPVVGVNFEHKLSAVKFARYFLVDGVDFTPLENAVERAKVGMPVANPPPPPRDEEDRNSMSGSESDDYESDVEAKVEYTRKVFSRWRVPVLKRMRFLRKEQERADKKKKAEKEKADKEKAETKKRGKSREKAAGPKGDKGVKRGRKRIKA